MNLFFDRLAYVEWRIELDSYEVELNWINSLAILSHIELRIELEYAYVELNWINSSDQGSNKRIENWIEQFY